MDISTFAPMLQPLAKMVWEQILLPELQKLDGQISSADLKVVTDAMLAAIDKVVEAEIPRI